MASRPFFDDPPPPPPAALPAPPRIRDAAVLPAPIRWARLLVRGREEDAAWVRPSLIGAARDRSAPLSLGSRRVGLGERLLLGRRPGGVDELEGVLLRLLRRVQLHHGGQVTGRALGHGSLRARLRRQCLEHPRPAGARGRRDRRVHLSHRAQMVPAGGGADRRRDGGSTPVAALMFRFDNPDALLVLLLTIATYATVRAIEAGKTKWLVLAATLVGFAFLTKMLQAFLVVPAFGLVYLLAAPVSLRRRMVQLAVAAGTMVVASGWWVAIVQLTPAADRPYIGGSQDNSLLNLIFGYNGFGRLTGNETGSVGGSGAAGSMWGPTGLDRLFNASFGGQISWLLPAALILLVAGLAFTLRSRAHRSNPGGLPVVGRLPGCHRAGLQPRRRDHPSRTTRWRWPRRSARSSAWAACCSGASAREPGRVSCSPAPWPPRASGRRFSSSAVRNLPQASLPRLPSLGIGSAVAIVAVPLMHRRGGRRSACRRPRRRVRGSSRLHHQHRSHAALRRHPLGRADGHRG